MPRTPFALGFALLHSDGHVDLYMDRRKVPDRTLAWLGNAVTLAPTDELGVALDTLGKVNKKVLIETATAPIWAANRLQGAGVDDGARRRSGGAAQGLQERRRDGRHPQRPSPRRRRGQPLPGLAGTRIERRQAARDRSVGPAAGAAPGDRQAARSQLRHHLRRRPQRRHRALSRLRGDRAHARAGQPLSGRFRRPVSRRHDRHHPHGGGRHAEPRDARPLHPRAQGPYRARHGALSRPARRARSSTRWRAMRCGRPASTTTTAPAMASAPISRCTKGRTASPRCRTTSPCSPA